MHDLSGKIIAFAVLFTFSQNGFAVNTTSAQPQYDRPAQAFVQPAPQLMARESRSLINIYDGLTDIHLDQSLS